MEILLVESNAQDESLIVQTLQTNEINKVTVARSGSEALSYFSAKQRAMPGDGELPRVMILELSLAGISGLEVLRKIREDDRTRFIPAIVLTSSREERDLREAYKAGANGFVRKPTARTEFVDVVRQLELYWLMVNEAPRLIAR